MISEATISKIHWRQHPQWDPYEPIGLDESVVVFRINAEANSPWLRQQRYLLDSDEQNRLNRLLKEEDQMRMLAGKIMAKKILSSYANCPVEAVKYGFTSRQKPYLLNEENLHFNIAHSGDCVVMVLSQRPCGIDVEKIQPDFDYQAVMAVAFHEAEKEAVRKSVDPLATFFRCWTIKESLLKATGVGLTDELPTINTLPGESQLPDALLDSVPVWQTESYVLDDKYGLSICHQLPEARIVFTEFSPHVW